MVRRRRGLETASELSDARQGESPGFNAKVSGNRAEKGALNKYG